MDSTSIREHMNMIAEAYSRWPADDEKGRPSWLIKKNPLGGFTPEVDPEFDKITTDDKLSLARLLATQQDPQESPEEALVRKQLRAKLRTLIDQLPPRGKQALLLWMSGASFAKIGASLEPPVKTERARIILATALRQLAHKPEVRRLKRDFTR